jgi:hypothetical protein
MVGFEEEAHVEVAQYPLLFLFNRAKCVWSGRIFMSVIGTGYKSFQQSWDYSPKRIFWPCHIPDIIDKHQRQKS